MSFFNEATLSCSLRFRADGYDMNDVQEYRFQIIHIVLLRIPFSSWE
jgi:hypothetical protein